MLMTLENIRRNGDVLLRAVDLTKIYSGRAEEVVVFRDLNLEVARGELVAVTGESGWPGAPAIAPASVRGAGGRGSLWPGRWSIRPRCSWPTSRPEILISAREMRFTL